MKVKGNLMFQMATLMFKLNLEMKKCTALLR